MYDGTIWQINSGRSFTQIPDGSPLKVSGENTEELKDTLANSNWRPDAKHVFINISDQALADLNDSSKLAAAINELSENAVEYISLGTSINQAQALSLIASNGGNGEFYINTNIDSALGNAAGYVVDSFKPRADVYINIGNTAQNNITTITGLYSPVKASPVVLDILGSGVTEGSTVGTGVGLGGAGVITGVGEGLGDG